MIVLFLIMIFGAWAYKINTIDDNASKKISALILNFTNPAMILSSVLIEERAGSLSTIGFIALIAISCYVFGILLGRIMPKLLKVPKEEHIFYNAMTVFSNYGYMGIPIVAAIYGSEYILYCSVFVFFNNIMVYTYGVYLFAKAANVNNQKIDFKSMLLNPGVIASFVSLLIYVTNMKFPPFFGKTASMMGDMTGPLSMIVIGVSLAKTKISKVFASARLWIFSAIRLVFVPVVLSFLYRIFIKDVHVFSILIVMLSMPVGSITIIFANKYGIESSLVSGGLLLTTILSVLTVPFVIFLTGI